MKVRGDYYHRKRAAYAWLRNVIRTAIDKKLQLDAKSIYKDALLDYGVGEKFIREALIEARDLDDLDVININDDAELTKRATKDYFVDDPNDPDDAPDGWLASD